jgi:hypothetical protein
MLKPKPMMMQASWEWRRVLGRDGHVGLNYMDYTFDKKVGDELTFEE